MSNYPESVPPLSCGNRLPMIRAVQFILLFALLTGVVSAADWDSKPFPGWSERTVIGFVCDSPWAKQIGFHL